MRERVNKKCVSLLYFFPNVVFFSSFNVNKSPISCQTNQSNLKERERERKTSWIRAFVVELFIYLTVKEGFSKKKKHRSSFPSSFRPLLLSYFFFPFSALGHLLEGRGEFAERLEGLDGDGMGLFFRFFLKETRSRLRRRKKLAGGDDGDAPFSRFHFSSLLHSRCLSRAFGRTPRPRRDLRLFSKGRGAWSSPWCVASKSVSLSSFDLESEKMKRHSQSQFG